MNRSGGSVKIQWTIDRETHGPFSRRLAAINPQRLGHILHPPAALKQLPRPHPPLLQFRRRTLRSHRISPAGNRLARTLFYQNARKMMRFCLPARGSTIATMNQGGAADIFLRTSCEIMSFFRGATQELLIMIAQNPEIGFDGDPLEACFY